MAIRRTDLRRSTKRFNPKTLRTYNKKSSTRKKKYSYRFRTSNLTQVKQRICLCKNGGKRCTRKVCRNRLVCKFHRNPSNNRCYASKCAPGKKRKLKNKYYVCQYSQKKLAKDIKKMRKKLKK